MSNFDYLWRLNERADLSADEYHKGLTDALEGWLLDLRHAKQDRVRDLVMFKDKIPWQDNAALHEDMRKTIGVLSDELGVGR